MIRRLLHLGQTPLMRRLIATTLLMSAGIAMPLWRASEGVSFWIDLTSGVMISGLALAFLHFRWRKNELTVLSEDTIRDTFS